MTTNIDNGQTWRDYLDQLTPQQIANLERHEQGILSDKPYAERALADQAAYWADCNRIAAQYADVPAPAGATIDAEGWALNLDTGNWDRLVQWAEYPAVVDASVCIDGRQNVDGSYSREISLYAEDCRLTAAQARELAAALMTAADVMDRCAE